MNEVWKEIVGFEGLYSVSNIGRVRRNISTKGKRSKEKIMAQNSTLGYMRVHLSKNNISYHPRVHRLVMQAFIGECPKGYEINHKDGKRDNNILTNLEYVTSAQNNYHARNILKSFRPDAAKGLRNGKYTHPEKIQRGDDHYLRRHPEAILRGQKNPEAKLTDEKVRQIRKLYQYGSHDFGLIGLSKKFGVSDRAIFFVIKRQTWKHVK